MSIFQFIQEIEQHRKNTMEFEDELLYYNAEITVSDALGLILEFSLKSSLSWEKNRAANQIN